MGAGAELLRLAEVTITLGPAAKVWNLARLLNID